MKGGFTWGLQSLSSQRERRREAMNYHKACQSEHRVNGDCPIKEQTQSLFVLTSQSTPPKYRKRPFSAHTHTHTHTHHQFSTLQLINLDCYDNQLIWAILLFSPQVTARLYILNEVQTQGCSGASDGCHRQIDVIHRLLPGDSAEDLLHTLRWEAAVVHAVNEHIQTNLNLSLLVSLLCTHTLYMCVHVLFTLINPDPFVIKINYV